jgi:hypothetical protein
VREGREPNRRIEYQERLKRWPPSNRGGFFLAEMLLSNDARDAFEASLPVSDAGNMRPQPFSDVPRTVAVGPGSHYQEGEIDADDAS